MRWLLAAVAALLVWPGAADAAGINVFIGSPTIPLVGSGDGANLWVDTNGGTCARQTLAGAYVDAAACSSMSAACTAASDGDSVRLREGTYGAQTLTTSCSGAPGNRITFDAENGATGCGRQMIAFVSVTSYTHNACPVNLTADLTIQGQDLNVKNMSTVDELAFPASTSGTQARVTTTNIHAVGFWLTGTDITVKDGEVGGFWVCAPGNGGTSGPTWGREDLGHIGFAPGGTVLRITVDGYLFHDLYDISSGASSCNNGNGPHSDCLQLAQGDTVVVKNSQFWNCATAGIQSNADWTPYTTISYLNNFFGKVYTGGNGAEMGTGTPGGSQADDCNGTNVIAYNTFSTDGAVNQVCADTGTFIIEGNIVIGGTGVLLWSNAGSSAPTIDYTVISSGSIGTNSKTCTPSFTGTFDGLDGLHLNPADTCASNAGKPGTSIVTTDADGGARAATPDAGADEIGVP